MPEFEHEERGVRFAVSDRPTVEQQLQWYGLVSSVSGTPNQFVRYWEAIKPMITEWECEFFPDYERPLAEVSDQRVTNLVTWACSKVLAFMNDLDAIPKKSDATGGGHSEGKE